MNEKHHACNSDNIMTYRPNYQNLIAKCSDLICHLLPGQASVP